MNGCVFPSFFSAETVIDVTNFNQKVPLVKEKKYTAKECKSLKTLEVLFFFFFSLDFTSFSAVQSDALMVPLTLFFTPTIEKILVYIVIIFTIIYYRSTENLGNNVGFPTQFR